MLSGAQHDIGHHGYIPVLHLRHPAHLVAQPIPHASEETAVILNSAGPCAEGVVLHGVLEGCEIGHEIEVVFGGNKIFHFGVNDGIIRLVTESLERPVYAYIYIHHTSNVSMLAGTSPVNDIYYHVHKD